MRRPRRHIGRRFCVGRAAFRGDSHQCDHGRRVRNGAPFAHPGRCGSVCGGPSGSHLHIRASRPGMGPVHRLRRKALNMSGFRVGVDSQVLNTRRSPTTMVRAVYRAAVAGGVDSFWVADHLNSLVPQAIATPRYFGGARLVPKIDAQLEPWTMLGRLAASNRIGRLRLGVGVTDSGRRNPAVTALAAATLHLLTRGRAILGIGVGEREGNEPYGVKRTKPVAELEEAVATIRTLWDSAGEPVTRDSPYFPLCNAMFALPPYRGKWPEIWVAAHGPRMLRITGRYADAWVPFVVSRPTDYARGLDAVRAAASD